MTAAAAAGQHNPASTLRHCADDAAAVDAVAAHDDHDDDDDNDNGKKV